MEGVQTWYRAIEKGSMGDFRIAARKFRAAVEMPSHASKILRAERFLFLGMTLLDLGLGEQTVEGSEGWVGGTNRRGRPRGI